MPTTLRLDANDPADIARAASLLRAGELVAFATETVYGLGASALSAQAVAKIFAAKQRPAWDPLIVHLATPDGLAAITSIPPELASRVSLLASRFWPGPLTLLVPRNAAIPDAVTAGRELVGVRIPSHPAAQALLRATGLPIAAPSANTFGHTSPTTAQHVLSDLAGRIAAVLDGGPTTIGLESTVLDPTQTPMVLYRPGAVSATQLTAATGVPVVDYLPPATETVPSALPSPGVGIRHYAPRATLLLVEPLVHAPTRSLLDANETTQNTGMTTGVMLPDEWVPPPASVVYQWGPWTNATALAARLFDGLRTLDDMGVTHILCPLPPPAPGLANAIRDRLQKAARSL